MRSAIEWTPEQKRAIETIDRGVLVSAAAGSGKTAVLAARCAHLVCDAPAEYRCDVDRLLVVTFTEAAAAEMKERIRRALRERSAAAGEDRRLEVQTALLDAAQISTLHAFCLWMVRRWFNRAGVDAAVQLLDEDEARILRQDTIDALFDELYKGNSGLAERFGRVVEDYGLGQDGQIAAFVLRLADFLASLPDAGRWLARAGDCSAAHICEIVDGARRALVTEVRRQAEYCASVADFINRRLGDGAFYGSLIREYAERLEGWHTGLQSDGRWDEVRGEIAGYELSSRAAPRLRKDTPDEARRGRDRARALFAEIQEKLLKTRLQGKHCAFSEAEMREGIARVIPYAATLADLATAFMRRFETVKRGMGVMDFADLERLAFRLLTERLEGEDASPVAAELRQRFAHVLVDEFQDINPLQARLLALVSGEGGGAGNLFTVGDVKQSIYRFRLAEPAMFLNREREFREEASQGACIDLQVNYRSSRNIIRGVNAVFARLMQEGLGGITYDRRAELKPRDPEAPPGAPIELHILERRVSAEAPEDERPRFVDVGDPAQWRSIEREGFLIGTRIRELIDAGTVVACAEGARPLTYRDVCVLLRSTRHSAGPLANMLTRMGVPTWTDAGVGLLAAMEVGDALSLLAVVDNFQQDIPVAAVLRSGILGERLDENDLAAIRVCDRDVAFHEAVSRYAEEGTDPDLRARLRRMIDRIGAYREQMRVRPLADVLWMIYRDTGYLDYVGGIEGGERRRANLIALHERARQFGQFRRQGLRRFLQFVESLQAEQQDLGAPPAIGEADDVVRIMSIHKAKGLEFPVVFAAEMGRRFNLSDSTGRLLFDRLVGIGLKAVDRDRLIEYPTALHRWCASAAEEASLAEELRVWYVAMTRAKERLILVGSDGLESVEELRALADPGAVQPGVLNIVAARAPLHWFVSALSGLGAGCIAWNESARGSAAVCFDVTTYDEGTIRSWKLAGERDEDADELPAAVAAMAPLPESEPVSEDPSAARRMIADLDYVYPYGEAASVPAVWAASEATAAPRLVDEAVGAALVDGARWSGAPASVGEAGGAVRRGRAVHAALQFLRLDTSPTLGGFAAEIARMVAEGRLDEAEADLVDVEALVWFFGTQLGRRIRAAPDRYHREWMFQSAEPVARLAPSVTDGGDDLVLVRGVVDGVLLTDGGVEVVDFKTDRVITERAQARADAYAMQMRLYASAVAAVFGEPVSACYLVFLHCRRIVRVAEALS